MRLLMGTNNNGKVREFSELLNFETLEISSLKDAGFSVEVEEDGTTFLENAIKKAKETFIATGIPSIGDDSGLMVDALDGAPGIYSARWAGEGATQDDLIGKLLRELSDKEKRSAKFVSVVAIAFSEDDIVTAYGECKGEILYERKGTEGFGYDPVFYVKEFDKTFAEMTLSEKNMVSHRANAIKSLKEKLILRGIK